MLARVRGPECPSCGCEDATVVDTCAWVGSVQDKLRCGHCGREYFGPSREAVKASPQDSPNAGVVYHVMRCPRCESEDCIVTSTRRPVRHHQCRACQFRFKSVEK